MDYLDIMFNKNRPFKPIKISGGTTNGRIKITEQREPVTRLPQSDLSILEDDVANMRQKLINNIKDTMANEDNLGVPLDEGDTIYKKYKFDQRSVSAKNLPIYASEKKIVSKISKYPVVVIEGSTGCGKSTQIPQMILDEARRNNTACNIVVTQPRRIAAKSIADRVSRERGWDLGTVVGYQIGLDKKFVSEDTRILFCTTGVLLEKLIHAKTLTNYTHIVLDEVHERDSDMDFLFIIIRILWAKDAANVKIILMSATIDTTKFAEYFRFYQLGSWVYAPIIKVDKKSPYKVQEFFLDDVNNKKLDNYKSDIPEIDEETPGISDDMYKLALALMRSAKGIDKTPDAEAGSILVFLPGIYEIGRMRTVITDYLEGKTVTENDENESWKIYILHSLISTEEQQSIFEPTEKNVRKIILSTNIAESSITVPDVKFVIDFCLMKYLKCDSSKNFTSLEMVWASKNNCKQRAGRAGRVSNGRCYRLVTSEFFNCHMKESPIPELLLAPLENVVLRAKTFEMGAPHEILGMAMDAPKLGDIANTVLTLKELGALRLNVKDEGYSPIDGDITFLGRLMSNLPIDVRATRLIALGFCYGVLEDCIIMAAGLTSKSIFKITFDRDLGEYTRRLEWSNGSGSDLFAIMNAYKIWALKHSQKEFGRRQHQQAAEREFCTRHYLDVRSLNECHSLVQELTRRLEAFGMQELTGVNRVRWTEQEKSIILKLVIAGAFYPNFYSTPVISNPMIERDVYRCLNGRDPNNTVFFTGFRQDYIRQLYVDSIRNLFRETVVDSKNIDRVKVSFDGMSEKVYVTFDVSQNNECHRQDDWITRHCSLPGKTQTEVYKAVKMRKMKMPVCIKVMSEHDEMRIAEEYGIGFVTGSTFTLKEKMREDIDLLSIPKIVEKEVVGTVTHIESCSKFWFQSKTDKQIVKQYNLELNNKERPIVERCTGVGSIRRDEIIAARDKNDDKLYRARLTSFEFDSFTKSYKVNVFFIDYGHTQQCDIRDLYIYTKKTEQSSIPPRCFQCRLAEIQPSTANISGGFKWDAEAIEAFKNFVLDRDVKAQVYSVINGTANVFILGNGLNLNDLLIKSGFGEFCEENFLSKNNHWKRKHAQKYVESEDGAASLVEYEDCEEYYPVSDFEPIKPPPVHMCTKFIHLKGPRSALESDVHSLVLSNGKGSVVIDAHSVNSVLLTSMQQDLSVKYLVAAHISLNGASNKEVTIHQTTLLPSIRGFGPLMAMIFCPNMDLKRDIWKSRYVSVRTGLGYDVEKGCPYFEEHDTVFPLDFEFTEEDLTDINQIRYFFNTLLFSFNAKNRYETISAEHQLKVMQKLKEVTLKLLIKERKAIEMHTVPHQWREYEPKEFYNPNDIYGDKSIFPMHGLIRLKPMDKTVKMRLKQHCADLRGMTMVMPRQIMCSLCATDIENVEMLRTHLMTRLHLEREKEIGFNHLKY